MSQQPKTYTDVDDPCILPTRAKIPETVKFLLSLVGFKMCLISMIMHLFNIQLISLESEGANGKWAI